MEAGPHRAAVVGCSQVLHTNSSCLEELREVSPGHGKVPKPLVRRSCVLRAEGRARSPRGARGGVAGMAVAGLEGRHDIGDGQNLLHCIASAFCTAASGPVHGDYSDTIAQFQIIEHCV